MKLLDLSEEQIDVYKRQTQNIMLGAETTKSLGVLDMNAVKKQLIELSEKYGLYVDPDAKIQDTSVGMQQRVEILKALYRGVDILILDEPTAVLTPQEIEELIAIMHRLTDDGKTVIIITHKLAEIKKSSNYCTIIRRGQYILSLIHILALFLRRPFPNRKKRKMIPYYIYAISPPQISACGGDIVKSTRYC